MPTLYRNVSRTWLYVPYAQIDAPTREAFHAKAERYGVLANGTSHKWKCAVCGRESTLPQIGVSFGDPAVGTPVCPADDCSGIGWDYFVEVPDEANR